MKHHAILCTAALGLALGACVGAAAQDSSGIVGEKGIIGEKAPDEQQADTKTNATAPRDAATPGRTAQVKRLDPAARTQLRKGAMATPVAPNGGLAPRPSAGGLGKNQNEGGKGPPNNPNENLGRPLGNIGTAGMSDEKLPHKEPKGPDKTPTTLGKVADAGWAGKSEDKPPPKDPEPKDPKGPDKLGQAAMQRDAVATPTQLKATRLRSAGAAQQATNAAKLQGQP